MNDHLSELLDLELKGPQRAVLLGELSRNRVLRAVWERYHLIGAVLRKEELLVGRQLGDRIAKCIELEPSLSVKRNRWMTARSSRTLGGLALAASIAAIAVFGLPHVLSFRARDQIAMNSAAAMQVRQADWENDLDGYLAEHDRFTPFPGNSMMSYVQFVDSDSS